MSLLTISGNLDIAAEADALFPLDATTSFDLVFPTDSIDLQAYRPFRIESLGIETNFSLMGGLTAAHVIFFRSNKAVVLKVNGKETPLTKQMLLISEESITTFNVTITEATTIDGFVARKTA